MRTVLDKGFVRLVDSMGDDSSIVQAARVSYGKGTKTKREDEKLIDYLYRHQHTSPFEMVEFKFHIKAPIFVARQWMRHRTASINEVSARYSVLPTEFYLPEVSRVAKQHARMKQGSEDEPVENADEFRHDLEAVYQQCADLYTRMVEGGVSREIARIILPVSTYTEWYWKIDLHNLLRFLRLRLDITAQYEIRVYAEAILELIRDIVPVTVSVFEKYSLGGVE